MSLLTPGRAKERLDAGVELVSQPRWRRSPRAGCGAGVDVTFAALKRTLKRGVETQDARFA